MALLHFSVIPIGTSTTSIGEHVADIQKVLQHEKATYQLTDMGTVLQGSTPDLRSLAAKLCEIPFTRGVQRVVTHIILDDRRDKSISIGDKTASVQARLAAYEEK